MTSYPSVLPAIAVSPAVERSSFVLTEVTDEVHTIDVPLLALMDGDVIRRHPESDEDVVWHPVTWQTGEGASVTYTTPGTDAEHVHGFGEPYPWVTVQAPAGEVAW